MNKMGFGFLRLNRKEVNGLKEPDIENAAQLVDLYMSKGGKFFDTAYTYLGGKSETALREALVKRYPRASYMICDKLAGYNARSYEDCENQFIDMQKRCGVDKFDVLMLHWLNKKNYEMAEKYDEFRFLRDMKAEGKADRIGFSYHDSPELLDEILVKHPEVDCVLIQINYLDWNSPVLQAKKLYEVLRKHDKSIFVMEPIKGGSLAKLPDEAASMLNGRTPANWALSFAQGLEGVEVVLSGMNAADQIEENMRDFEPLTEAEEQKLMLAAELLRSSIAVACTACGYCLSHCPKGIAIPDYMALYNEVARNKGEGWKMGHVYREIAVKSAPAAECIGCKACESNCPQKIEIADTLKKLAETFK